MKRNSKRWLRTGAIAGATAAAVVGSMLAAPAPSTAFVEAGVTDYPELVSATLDGSNRVGSQMNVVACFDEVVSVVNLGQEFYARTYDSGRYLQAIDADVLTVAPHNSRCVAVQFDPQVDLNTQGSILELDAGGVVGAHGENYYTSVPFANSTLTPREGQSTGPDLIKVDLPSSTPNRAIYFFDQAIDAGSPDPLRFGAVDNQGAAINTAGNVVRGVLNSTDKSESQVTIEFAEPVSNKTHFYVDEQAVATLPVDGTLGTFSTTNETFSPAGAYILPGTAASNRPVLETAEYQGAGNWLLTYSQAVDPANFAPGSVLAVFDNANVVAGEARTLQTANEKIVVRFGSDSPVAEEPSAVVKIVSAFGAAQVFGSPLSIAPVSFVDVNTAPMTPGRTTGPDLLGMEVSGRTAKYFYDEPVDYTSPSAFDFRSLVKNGPASDSEPPASRDGHVVEVTYEQTGAIGVTSAFDAVRDALGQPSVSSASSVAPPAKPVARHDPVSIAKGATATVPVLGNDSNVAGGTVSLSAVPTGVSAVVNGTNVVVEILASYSGQDSFTIPYTVSTEAGTSSANIEVTVAAAADPAPTANDDPAVSVARGATATVDVLANDEFAGNPVLTSEAVPTGFVVGVSDSKLVIAVPAGYSGPNPATVTYKLTTAGGSDLASVLVNVTDGDGGGTPGGGTDAAQCGTLKANATAATTAATTAKDTVKKLKKKVKKAKGAKKKKLKKKLSNAKKASKSAAGAATTAQAAAAGC